MGALRGAGERPGQKKGSGKRRKGIRTEKNEKTGGNERRWMLRSSVLTF